MEAGELPHLLHRKCAAALVKFVGQFSRLNMAKPAGTAERLCARSST
jgi:hypothetical protein